MRYARCLMAISILASTICSSSCRTVYVRAQLPEYDGGKVNYKEYNSGNLSDLRRIIVLQDEIIKGWERFYSRLREEYAK